jgi:hypothetical protein
VLHAGPFTWGVRAAWLLLPFTAGQVAGDALADASEPVRLVAATGQWTGWAIGLVALLVPRPVGLTLLRVLAPASLTISIAAAIAGHASVVAIVVSAAVAVASCLPELSTDFANGAAYGDERRFPLRVGAPLLLGPVPLAWGVLVAALSAGPLLLAAEQWVAGAVALLVGGPVALVLVRALHGLSRRWVVFVPAGMVLHDPASLRDPVLFRRAQVDMLQPAPVDTDGLDLTQRAPGLVLELVLREKVPITLTRLGAQRNVDGASARLLFVPARPGAVLAEARARRIPTAAPTVSEPRSDP